ncbi:WFDC1 [Branchiostoma lanceolatum]|uniref:WFDC1 protein n=1 Tax=Branchiostoma lanceolatum TaxID=7740 RepID=A0A8J9W8L9_BRALA|nr:WFDC1 [Branchiostoma lanceolatum]
MPAAMPGRPPRGPGMFFPTPRVLVLFLLGFLMVMSTVSAQHRRRPDRKEVRPREEHSRPTHSQESHPHRGRPQHRRVKPNRAFVRVETESQRHRLLNRKAFYPDDDRFPVPESLRKVVDGPTRKVAGDGRGEPLEVGGDEYRCPPPLTVNKLRRRVCQQAKCVSDSTCGAERRCCFNGCVFTCLDAVPPPAVLDWLEQPSPQRSAGYAWLVAEPEEVMGVETCSTTTASPNDLPLECPHGYVCHITNQGDPNSDIPNAGICIKGQDDESPRQFRLRSGPTDDGKASAETEELPAWWQTM